MRCAAPVVQDRAGGRGAAAPAARCGEPADRTLDEQRPAERAPDEDVLDRRKVPIPSPVVKDRQHASRAIARGDHPVSVSGRQRHHLVHHAVSRRLERAHGQLGVRVVRRRDHHQSDDGIGQGVIQGGIAVNALAPEHHGLGPDGGITRDDPVQSQPRLPADQWTVERPARQTVADDDGRNHDGSPH